MTQIKNNIIIVKKKKMFHHYQDLLIICCINMFGNLYTSVHIKLQYNL